jgi:hypothetical protein
MKRLRASRQRTCPLGMCVLRNPKSLHEHKINRHLPIKHLHQPKMRIKLKTMKKKIKKISHLKRRTMIKGGDDNDQDKEDDQEVQGPRPPHPRVHQAIQRDHPVNSILGDIHKGVTTRSRIAHFCEHYSFVSSIEPYRVEDALKDSD